VVALIYIPTCNVWGFLFLSHPRQYLLLVVFLMVAILTGVRWNLSVILILISFMTRDVKHIFMCFSATWTSSFEKTLSSSFSHFLLGPWFGGDLVFWVHCVFWSPNPCQIYGWQIFSPILWEASTIYKPFHLLFRSFLILCSPICHFFLLVAEPFEFYLGSHCLCLSLPV
jgi:hypothetical protein